MIKTEMNCVIELPINTIITTIKKGIKKNEECNL